MSEIKLTINERDALNIAEWLVNREGVAVWKSANLSNPSGQWLTPAKTAENIDTPKPTWQAQEKPEIITSPFEIEVRKDVLFKTLRVALRRASLSLKLTDDSQRRLNTALEACNAKHESCHWEKGDQDLDYPHISIYYPATKKLLSEYFADKAGKALNEVAEATDSEIRSQLGEQTTQPIYCLATPHEPDAGICRHEITPWFNDRITLAIYCLINREKLLQDAAV